MINLPVMHVTATRPKPWPREGCQLALDDLGQHVNSGVPDVGYTVCDQEGADDYWWCMFDRANQAYEGIYAEAYWAVYNCSDRQ